MRALLLLLWACAPKSGPPPAAAALSEGAVAAPDEAQAGAVLLPADAPTWDDTWPPIPAQPGFSAGQELGAALTSRTVFRIEADVSPLAHLTAEQVGVLRDELAEDPRWKVTTWAGATVAMERQRQGDGWSVGWGGYAGADPVARVALWLDAPPWGPEVRHNDVRDQDAKAAGSAASPLIVASWPSTGAWAGRSGALLAVRGQTAALEVHELAKDLQLARTAQALTRVPVRVEETARGLAPRHPVAPPSPGAGKVWVEAHSDAGMDVRVRANPGAPGWTWLRLVGEAGAVSEALVLRASLERLGHSTDDVQYPGQSWLPVAPPSDPATLELWFLADGASEPVRLLTAPLAVPQAAPAPTEPPETSR